jgi:putative tryptophan/tyrosine transport system substrate-binding protein
MRRREFIALLGGAAAAWPLAASAQQAGRVFRIGYLGVSLNAPLSGALYQVFLSELRELGFSEGQNLAVEYRRLDDARGTFVIAAELVRSPLDLIVAQGPEVALQAVVGASGFIPIVIQAINFDPVERGYVSSLARPGGNITGLFYRQSELAAKKVELLTQAFPERTRLVVLWDVLTADEFSAAERAACIWSFVRSSLKTRLMISPQRFGRWRRAAHKCSLSCPAPSLLNTVGRSLNWRSSIACPPCSSSRATSRWAD